MRKLFIGAMIAAATMVAPFSANAFDLKDLLGKAGGNSSSITDAIGGAVEGLLTQSDITVEQMAGNWTSTGSAVSFQSDNLLKKAGGSAVSSSIEKKVNDYYKKLGLNGSTLTIDKNGNFTLKAKKISLKGTITKRSDGNFNFTFTPYGNIKLGSVKTYVEKTPAGLNVMFDASKLMSLISTLSGVVNNSTLSAATSLLNSYDGLCVGFAFK